MADEPLVVTIAGGSIGGLCAGIALLGIGADVSVYERIAGTMETRGAGIVVQPDLTALLHQHRAPVLPTTSCSYRRYLSPEGGSGQAQRMPQAFTSWEAIYMTLRAAFPDERYHMAARIADIRQDEGRVTATIGGIGEVASDLLVGADGIGSVLRRRFLPDVEPTYAGYVAWRGTLDESSADPALVNFYDDAFTFCDARSGGHMLVYLIPGDGAATAPGTRRLNWVWYVGADNGDLDRFLTDKDGHRHHSSLALGEAAPAVVRELRDLAVRELHPRMAELVASTSDPFLQTIVDVSVPKTVFGRIALVGDAAFVVRPHTAAAAAKAARDARVLATSLQRARGNIDAGLASAEALQLEEGRGLVRYGVALGERWARNRAGRRIRV